MKIFFASLISMLALGVEHARCAMSARTAAAAASTPRFELAALTLLRVGYGLVILTHGVPKLLHLPHGTMGDPFSSTTRLIAATVGPTFATPLAWAVTLLETAGAALLAVGLLTRLVALAFAIEMVGISIAMGPTWVWIDRGIEYPVMLGLVAGYLAVRGGGGWSADAWRRRQGAFSRAPRSRAASTHWPGSSAARACRASRSSTARTAPAGSAPSRNRPSARP